MKEGAVLVKEGAVLVKEGAVLVDERRGCFSGYFTCASFTT